MALALLLCGLTLRLGRGHASQNPLRPVQTKPAPKRGSVTPLSCPKERLGHAYGHWQAVRLSPCHSQPQVLSASGRGC